MKNIYAFYKPKGPTSHDIINQLRRITGVKRIGHAGTLDPLASGVLVVGITREGTRELSKYIGCDKEYIATIRFGETSETDDAEGKKQLTDNNKQITKIQIKNILKQFIGKIKQVPPVYSSVKVQGKPAHRRVRAGQKIILGARDVEIYSIKILSYKYPYLKIKVVCSSGTYIRSLARDIGQKLKVGAYLSDLERTRVGDFKIENCCDVDNFQKIIFD